MGVMAVLIETILKSHPTRVRGLKFAGVYKRVCVEVAPHAGAWIEIMQVIE